MNRIFLANIFFFIIIISSTYLSVNACWCRKDPEETNTEEKYRKTISELVTSSDFVFSGTLIEEDQEHLTFKVESSWKGNISDRITFLQLHNLNKQGEKEYFVDSCSYLFERGKSYLIYANVSLFGLEVSKCGRTDLLTNAQRDVTQLSRQKQVSTVLSQLFFLRY